MVLSKRFNLICGHYGCGKTNLSLNLALDCAKEGKKVTLVDLDLVNPYFRSSDYAKTIQEELQTAASFAGDSSLGNKKKSLGEINVIAPVYANSNVDVPSLPAQIYGIFDSTDMVIVDVGGDDVGATVLGRFSSQILALDYDLFYVINRYRNLTATPKETVQVLREIERVSRINATALLHNSHLKSETTSETILSSIEYANEVSRLCGLPIRATTVPRDLYLEWKKTIEDEKKIKFLYPVDLICKSCFE